MANKNRPDVTVRSGYNFRYAHKIQQELMIEQPARQTKGTKKRKNQQCMKGTPSGCICTMVKTPSENNKYSL